MRSSLPKLRTSVRSPLNGPRQPQHLGNQNKHPSLDNPSRTSWRRLTINSRSGPPAGREPQVSDRARPRVAIGLPSARRPPPPLRADDRVRTSRLAAAANASRARAHDPFTRVRRYSLPLPPRLKSLRSLSRRRRLPRVEHPGGAGCCLPRRRL
jgi:hypothetical protein